MKPVTIGEVTAYWDRRPCNIFHGQAPVGSSEWSAQVTARKYLVEPHILDFADFPRWRGKHVLEIGCGIGTDTLQFVQNGAWVDALDVSFGSLTLARARVELLPELQLGRQVMLFEMNAEKRVPHAAGPVYDLVYSFGVLHHTPNPERVLAKAYGVLKSGGELRVMVYAKRSIKNWLDQQPEAQTGCPLARRYSRRAVKKLITGAGFIVESIRQDHIFPYQIEDYVRYRYVKHWAYRVMPKVMFRWLERRLGWHLLIVARKA